MNGLAITGLTRGQQALALAGLAGATVVGAGAALDPRLALLGGLALLIVALSAARPAWMACFLLGATPLLAGIGRGSALPLVRPYEALGLLIGLGVVLRLLLSAREHDLRFERLDAALLAMALAASVYPLFVMKLRSRDIQQEDILYAFQLWKYYGVFLIMRVSIRTPRQVRAALMTAIVSVTIVGAIAMLQALRIGGVDVLIGTYFPPDSVDTSAASSGRGTTTIGSSIAAADVTVYAFGIAAAWLLTMRRRPPLLPAFAFGLVLGVLGTGQFTGVIGLGIAALTLGVATRRLGRFALALAPAVLLAAVVLQPVIERRLEPLQRGELPQSWEVRLRNLETFFWPVLAQDYNWITGVRPQARVAAPPGWPAGRHVYIESGLTWLLWSGGLLLFFAFCWFLWVAMRRMWGIARAQLGEASVAATAAGVALTVMGILMLLDPHLSFRASSDLSFSLMGIAIGGTTWHAYHDTG